MELTYLSIATFIITTVVYYTVPSIGKISVSLKALSSVEEMETFKRESNIRLSIYLAVVILTQFILNTSFVINACGGTSISNYGSAFLITFLPWIFIFGIMLITLIMYPGFKGAFADVVGYFFVSDKANTTLSEILMSDSTVQTAVDGVADAGVKSELTRAAESITKMLGNKAIIINQITPFNFIEMWTMMKQLMKPTVFENEELKSKLLDVSVMRDNIGESFWYIYTGILIISYTSYKITTGTCPPNINNLVKKKVQSATKKVASTANNAASTVKETVVPVANNASSSITNATVPLANNAASTVKETVVPTFK